MKLLNTLYQVGGPGLTHPFDATAYLIKGKDGYYLIDCCTVEGFEQLKANIERVGVDPKEIRAIFATHGHYDHIGAAKLWKEEFGTKLYIHEADREAVEKGDGMKTSSMLLYGVECPPCKVDGLLKDGDKYEFDNINMEVMHTPGHTMGSVCFVLESSDINILIAGDTIWGGFSNHIGSDEDIWKKSLEKITSRHFDFFTFGHVNPQLIADADTRLKEAKMSFANYYNPWFKTFNVKYRY